MDSLTLHTEEMKLLVMALERTREYAQGLAAETGSILWSALHFTTRFYGHPNHKLERSHTPINLITVKDSRSVTAHGMVVWESTQNEKWRQQVVLQ